MIDTIDKFSEKLALSCYWTLIGMKSFFDYITDSETKRKYWEKILERKICIK